MSSRPRLFEMQKAPETAYAVEIDISDWLGSETIQSVTYAAEDESDGSDVTSTLLDGAKNTFTGAILKPWIRAGSSGSSYIVSCLAVTTTGAQDIWCVRVIVKDVA